ncbi:MAG: hypothetical protein JF612_02135 [Planctomycetia bacterium]|nr:hypothetical protein [Planctomycetia bacterium]
MFWNRSLLKGAAAVGLAILGNCAVARSQSPAPTPQPQPSPPANVVQPGTLPLSVIAEPQQVRVGDARLMTVNLFGQERDSFDQVREAERAATPTLPPVSGTPQPGPAATPAPSVISNPLRPAVVNTGATIGLDVERHGQIGRLVLNMTEPVTVRAAEAPVVQAAAAPTVPSAIAPVTTPSGRVVENIPVAPAAAAPLDHPTIARSKVLAPGSGSTTGPGVSGTGDTPQGPGTPGLGSAPAEGGGSAAMRTGRNAPVKPGQAYGTGRLY